MVAAHKAAEFIEFDTKIPTTPFSLKRPESTGGDANSDFDTSAMD